MALDQYALLASAAGAFIRKEGWGGKYIVKLDGSSTAFNNFPALRPWFLEKVIPRIKTRG
ncbi:MAG: hypothetical protein EON58_07025 [Alphaproteobacteria bacterium]|nr:MAG: hypothetical protein EON58_07025 [Alphaproteobacteria bacterium]